MSQLPHLRVTQRCLRDDLGLDVAHASRDARHYCAEHEALQTFVGKRSGAPDVGEPALRMGPSHGSVKTLHINRGRAVTIFDADKNVCWLIGYGPTHAKGEDRDVFNDFERLDGRGELLPTADDYELLETLSTAAQIDALTELGLALYEEARSEPGVEVNRTLGLKDGTQGSMLIVIDLEVFDDGEAEQGWIVFTIPPQTGIGEEQLYDVLNAVLPSNMDLGSLARVAQIGDRTINYNELAWTWSCYPDE